MWDTGGYEIGDNLVGGGCYGGDKHLVGLFANFAANWDSSPVSLH